MKTRFLLIAALISLFSLVACCPMISLNPISQPAINEAKLAGVWKLDSEKDENVFLHITPVSENKMAVVMVEHKPGKGFDVQQVPFHLSKLKSGLYINIDTSEFPGDDFKDKVGYIFCRIDLKNTDRLTAAMLDEGPIIAAIKAGELKGILTYRKPSTDHGQSKAPLPESKKRVECVTITDSSENIQKYLSTHDNETLFTDQLNWKRID